MQVPGFACHHHTLVDCPHNRIGSFNIWGVYPSKNCQLVPQCLVHVSNHLRGQGRGRWDPCTEHTEHGVEQLLTFMSLHSQGWKKPRETAVVQKSFAVLVLAQTGKGQVITGGTCGLEGRSSKLRPAVAQWQRFHQLCNNSRLFLPPPTFISQTHFINIQAQAANPRWLGANQRGRMPPGKWPFLTSRSLRACFAARWILFAYLVVHGRYTPIFTHLYSIPLSAAITCEGSQSYKSPWEPWSTWKSSYQAPAWREWQIITTFGTQKWNMYLMSDGEFILEKTGHSNFSKSNLIERNGNFYSIC